MKLRYKVAAVLSIATLLAGTAVANSVLTKPEYITASTDAAEIKPLAYAGDTFSGFTIQGIPDGMGAMRNADGTITLLSVHEVPSYGAIGTLAKAADKGKAIQGTSITKFTLNKAGDRVLKASDMVKSWSFYNYNTGQYQESPVGAAPKTQTVGMDSFISRFCSATLVQAGALSFKDGSTTLGYEGAVFLSGEEDGDSGYGRGFAFDMDGNDNAFRAAYGKNKAVDVKFEKTIWDADMKTQQLDHAAKGTEMTRVEDGEWDPSNPNVFYFLTTESNKDPGATTPNPATPSVSRDGGGLWRLTFVDGQKPELGAKLELLLDGTEAPFLSKPDNLAVTSDGVVLIQEDPGKNALVARIVAFRVKDSKLATVAQFNPDHFSAGGSKFMTTDEESSGIIDVTSIVAKPGDTKKYFYFNAQVHTTGAYAARPDLTTKSPSGILKFNQKTLEGGAYYSLTISDWKTVFGS